MKLIQPFLGRRQFIIGSVASASALAFKKLVTGKGVAMASDGVGTGGMGVVTNKYPHLLSPLKVRNRVLKNRILHTPSPPHSLQGPENFPADSYRAHYSEIAKNAAIVTMVEHFGQYPKSYDPNVDNGMVHYSDSMWQDIPPVHNYVHQMIEEIHCEGSLVCVGKLQAATVEEAVTQAKKWEDEGYDVIEVGERSWSGIDAVRADLKKLEAIRNSTNLIIEAVILPLTRGKSRGPAMGGPGGMPGMGRGEMPEGGMPGGGRGEMPSGERGGMPPMAGGGSPTVGGIGGPYGDIESGPELEEVLEMVKLIEGLADILRMKDIGHNTNHPNSFTMEKDKPWTLPFAQAIREKGLNILTAPNGGFHVPALNESFIAAGKTDMVAMATPLFADPQYVQKAYEGRAEDIVPCVRCHNCHGISRTEGPWIDSCTVNPKWGLSETKKRSIRPPTAIKKVAVIGGGPAGMKAAITAAERGHRVTLYEKSDAMGGLLRHTDYTKWKWGYKDFKDYLVRQIYKAGVEVLLNTEVTPKMIRARGYHTVLAATGAEPIVPNIPGADGDNVFNILDAYRNKKALGKNVVVIGAGVYGTETAICLAKDGHKVTVLASGKEMIPPEATGPHNMENQLDLSQNHENISHVLEAIATRISGGKVTYRDAAGSDKSVEADSVVIFAGFRPKMDEALKFTGSAGQVLLLGDCTGTAGTVQKTIRSAFFVASQV
jgi:NADPH-dependent 2,4-dienoyl-CoA reductase/sulfur reductase-like enzyme